MTDGMLKPGQATVLVVAVIATLAIPAGAVAGGMVGPDTADDSGATTSGDGPTDGNDAAATSGTNETRQVDHALASELLAIMDDESRSQREVALDAADTVLESRQQQANGESSQLARRQIATQRTNLRGARALLEITDDTGGDSLDRAVRLTEAGMKLQIAQQSRSDKPVDPTSVELPSVQTPSHDSPSGAALGLLEREDVTPTATEAEEIRSLDDIPDPTRSELTDVLDAYLAYYDATQAAAEEYNRSRLRALTNNWTRLQATDVDVRNQVAQVRAAQLQLLEETADLETALTNSESFTFSGSQVIVAQTLCLGTTNDETYSSDCILLIDPAGNEVYDNNAGGSRGFGSIAALIDLDGSDKYHGQNGGASGFGAAGFLVDADNLDPTGSDDDIYNATKSSQPGNGTNGGANSFGSVGFLLDAMGSDTYLAGNNATNGGARLVGQGFLLDMGFGSDDYIARKEGTNGGARLQGKGFLFDEGGSDEYNTSVNNITGVNVHTRRHAYDGGDLGTNGGGSNGGVGFLLDSRGNDNYTARGNGTNGGARFLGKGFLLDVRGTDNYTANYTEDFSTGINGGGSTGGSGSLIDVGGDGTEEYIVENNSSSKTSSEIAGVNGGGSGLNRGITGINLLDSPETIPASGLLLNIGSGDSTYRAAAEDNVFGTNGGAYFNATGTLVDRAGTDTYNAISNKSKFTRGVNGGVYGSVTFASESGPGAGLLLDALGSGDTYSQENCSGTDDTNVPKGVVGAQIDVVGIDSNPTVCG